MEEIKKFEEFNRENRHTMSGAINYEQSNFSKQDEFYKKIGHEKVIRHEYNKLKNDIDTQNQRSDIDVTLIKDNNEYKISEKRRETNFGDMLFEIYSVYENNKFGWSITGKSDGVVYFVDSKKNPYVGLFKTDDLHKIIKDNDILNQIGDKIWRDLYEVERDSYSVYFDLKINNEVVTCQLIKSYTKSKETGKILYHTMSVGIPYYVIDKCNVNYQLTNWDGVRNTNVIKNKNNSIYIYII